MNLVGVPFDFTGMKYYSCDEKLAIDSQVICETAHGTYLGFVKKIKSIKDGDLEREDFYELFPKILRQANFEDIDEYEKKEKFRESVVKFSQEQSNKLNLEIVVMNCYIDLGMNKILITFQSDSRIDFRDLVKILISKYHVKIELRQIGPRDYASFIGGIGPCGLPLCCSTFMSSFEGITIDMAKNQLLTLNIVKLSGQCGKLLCCLKYEDEAYSAIKKSYPEIGDKLYYKGSEYEVTAMNYLSDSITCYNGINYETFTKQEYKRAQAGIVKKEKEFADINSNVNLSGYGVDDTNNRIEQINVLNDMRENNKNNNFINKPNNKKNRNNNKKHFEKKNPVKKESGFIPVSQIQDRSILEVDNNKNNDKK